MGGSDSKPATRSSPPPPPNPELDRPWRKFDSGQKAALKEKLENFSLSKPDVKDIKILVAGQVGAGKSSFINSINSAFQGRISSRALVTSAEGDSHSFTKKLQGFIIKSEEKTLPFIFKDTMGLEAVELERLKKEDIADVGSRTEDIINTVFGHVKDGYKFNPEQPISYKDQHYISDPSLSNQCFCVVYVIAANTVQLIEDELIKKLRIVRKIISDKGIPQVVVMTKVDEICPLVKEDLKKIYKSKKIKEKMELCSAKVGVPMCNIFPVKNYHNEMDTNDDVDFLILKALEQIVQIANDKLEDSELKQ